jgi:penicillin G amidase
LSVLARFLDLSLRGLAQARRPRLNGRLRVSGLAAPVEVLRDAWGVPHIYAENIHDLLFAQGFIHAQDRLWQMEFQRRLVAGRLAEVIGPQVVTLDRSMRILGLRCVAEQESAGLSEELRGQMTAYAAGVNACLEHQPLPVEFTLLRYRPEPWTPADSLSWSKMLAWSLSINWETELLRARLIETLGPECAAELEPPWRAHWPVVAPSSPAPVVDARGAAPQPTPASTLAAAPVGTRADAVSAPLPEGGSDTPGSNNWVVAGRRTASGMPLLANDMHLLMSAPAIWYENHLVCDTGMHRAAVRGSGEGEGHEETLNVTGVSFPGIPYVISGHNGYVAWGFTNGFPDVQDLYIERMRATPDGGAEYEYCGEWYPAAVRRERIHVKGAAPVEQTIICTRHGPVINDLARGLAAPALPTATGLALPAEPLALRWTALEPNTMVDALVGMNRARSCLEFREALRRWETPVQNVVYADTRGNTGYSYPGHVPVRRRGDGSVPVPGWTDEYEWQGYIPFDELPHLYNPPQGFVVSANNRVTDDAYPKFLGREFAMGDRAQRIVELLAAQRKLDTAAVCRMHLDTISPTMQLVAGYLGKLPVVEPDLLPVVERVRRWDGRLTADSAAGAICEIFLREFALLVLESHLPASADGFPSLAERLMGKGPTPFIQERTFFTERTWSWALDLLASPGSHWFNLGSGETQDQVMQMALRRTMAYLTERLGPPLDPELSNWAWGRLHSLIFAHTLGAVPALGQHFDRGPYPLPGDGSTVWATGSGITPARSRSVVGPPFRFIADLGDLRNSLGLLAPGNSGRPDSPHYDDQIEAWFKGEYHPMLYAREDVVSGTKMKLWLEG